MTTSPPAATFPPRRDLTDGVVLLREPGEADVPALIEGARTPDVVRFTRVPSPYGEEHARRLLTIATQGWAESTDAVFAVCDHDRPELLLGLVGLHEIELHGEPGGVAEIGYWLAPAGRGRGLMTRAVRLASDWAFDSLGLARISWYARSDNTASRRVAEGAGYVVEGLVRRGLELRGERVDHWVGSLLPEDVGRVPGRR